MTPGPSLAEQARTVLAGSSVATLVTRGCPGARALAPVRVEDGRDGNPSLWLEEDSPAVRQLGDRRVVSLLLPAPAPFRFLELTGLLRTSPVACPGHLAYRLSLLSVRFAGRTSASVRVADFVAARPDPLRDHAQAVLQHLERAHAGELLACLHAHGLHDAVAVVPRGLDRYGVSLSALCRDGVRSLRLEFPNGPVDRLEDVALGLRVQLTCRCRRDARS
jgi:hypothetical protein